MRFFLCMWAHFLSRAIAHKELLGTFVQRFNIPYLNVLILCLTLYLINLVNNSQDEVNTS